MTVLREVIRLNRATTLQSLSGNVRIVDTQYRNINLFPFRCTRVTVQLRTDYPSTDVHCRGNLAPSAVRILTGLCFYYCRNSHSYTVHRNLHPCFCPYRTPLYAITLLWSVVSVVGLSPVHFLRPKSRLVSCYALF